MDGYRLQKTTIIYEKIRERKNFFWKRKQESGELNVVKCQKQIVARRCRKRLEIALAKIRFYDIFFRQLFLLLKRLFQNQTRKTEHGRFVLFGTHKLLLSKMYNY